MVAEGGVVEDPCERTGAKWVGQISPSTAPPESGLSSLRSICFRTCKSGTARVMAHKHGKSK
jgi:hypothetical protein